MADKKSKASDAADVCPFPPDREPRESSLLSYLCNFYNEFFGKLKVVLTVISIAGALLGLSLLSVPPALIAPLVDPESWNRAIPEYSYSPTADGAWIPDYGHRTFHEENLILEGDDVLIMENCTLVLEGQLLAQDNAKLVLRNVQFLIEEKEVWGPSDLIPYNVHVCFDDSAVFECHNSTIYHPEPYCKVAFLGASKANVLSSNLTNVQIFGEENSFIVLSNSFLKELDLAGNSRCDIISSEVYSIGYGSLLYMSDLIRAREQACIAKGIHWKDCRAEAWNSTIHHVFTRITNFSILNLSEPLKGYRSYLNLYRDLGVGGWLYNLTLHNTNIAEGWSVNAMNGDMVVMESNDFQDINIENSSLSITNCTLRSLSCGKGSSADINDSLIYYFIFDDDSVIKIADSKATILATWETSGQITFDKVIIEKIWHFDLDKAYIKGSVNFLNSTPRGGFQFFSLTRNFEVQVQGGTRVLPDVKLLLYDQDNEPVWTGLTDKDGRAFFNVSFMRFWRAPGSYDYVTNYLEERVLEANWKNSQKNVNVSMLMDTPITISFKEVPEPLMWELSGYLTPISSSIIVLMVVGFLSQRLRR